MRFLPAFAVVPAIAFAILIPSTSAVAAEPGQAVPASQALIELTVAAPVTTGFDRALFNHWVDADDNGCDTRQEVLIAEAVPGSLLVEARCAITTGQWYSWYDGATWNDASDLDVDHFVPLSEAWQSGADRWTAALREQFANDLGFDGSLVAVTDNVNASKGDRDPASWMPPSTTPSVQCDYATTWVLVKYRWNLAIDTAERSALQAELSGDCGSASVTLPTRAGALAPAPAPVPGPAPAGSPVSTPVHRFWSPVYNGHFFTTSATEKDSIIRTYPGIWIHEGERFRAFATQVPGTVPLYRFWSAKLKGHFYTTSEVEKGSVISDYDDHTWKYERIAYYVYPANSRVANTSAVERFWSANYQHHFYTAVAAEAAQVKKYPKDVWAYERTSFRVPTSKVVLPPKPPVVTPRPPVTPPAPYYRNCDAVRAAGNAPIYRGQPGFGSHLDRDGDGKGCE